MLDSTGARKLARNIVLAARVWEQDEVNEKRSAQKRAIVNYVRNIPSWVWTLFYILVALSIYLIKTRHYENQIRLDYLDLSKLYLHQILSEESPHFNVSLWMCPHGRPGPRAYLAPVKNVYMQHNLNARCVANKGRCSAIKIAKRVAYEMSKLHSKTIIDDRMPYGPIASEIHPRQEQYCLRSVAEHCESDVEECPFYNDLVDYWKRLVNVPCGSEHLMGPMGPPGKMDVYQCDVFLQQQ